MALHNTFFFFIVVKYTWHEIDQFNQLHDNCNYYFKALWAKERKKKSLLFDHFTFVASTVLSQQEVGLCLLETRTESHTMVEASFFGDLGGFLFLTESLTPSGTSLVTAIRGGTQVTWRVFGAENPWTNNTCVGRTFCPSCTSCSEHFLRISCLQRKQVACRPEIGKFRITPI